MTSFTATFRSPFSDVPIPVRRLFARPCHGKSEAKRPSAVAPELAHVTARYAAPAPYGKAATCCRNCFRPSGGEHGRGAKQDDADRDRGGAQYRSLEPMYPGDVFSRLPVCEAVLDERGALCVRL